MLYAGDPILIVELESVDDEDFEVICKVDSKRTKYDLKINSPLSGDKVGEASELQTPLFDSWRRVFRHVSYLQLFHHLICSMDVGTSAKIQKHFTIAKGKLGT